MQLHYYRAFGLCIESALEIPELPLGRGAGSDLKIHFGIVPAYLNKPQKKADFFDSRDNIFLYVYKTIGRFQVVGGRFVTIQPEAHASMGEIRSILLGQVFSGLFLQRNSLPIHGSVVSRKGKATVISGSSGAGKSSLAASLGLQGYRVITDDLAIAVKEDKKWQILPGISRIKLNPDVAEKLKKLPGIAIRPGFRKHYASLDQEETDSTVDVCHILILGISQENAYSSEELKGANKLDALLNHTIRINYITDAQLKKVFFHMLSLLADQSRIYRVLRPTDTGTCLELAKLLRKDILEGQQF